MKVFESALALCALSAVAHSQLQIPDALYQQQVSHAYYQGQPYYGMTYQHPTHYEHPHAYPVYNEAVQAQPAKQAQPQGQLHQEQKPVHHAIPQPQNPHQPPKATQQAHQEQPQKHQVTQEHTASAQAQPAKSEQQQPEKPRPAYLVAHRPPPGTHQAPILGYVYERPINQELDRNHPDFAYEVHGAANRGRAAPQNEVDDDTEEEQQSPKYQKLVTAHSKEAFRAKDVNDPHIYYHEYEDFPPDFYKAEFYEDAYNQIMQNQNVEDGKNLPDSDVHYTPLKIHSLSEHGFFYYDNHAQTSFKEETGYDAYIAGHHSAQNDFANNYQYYNYSNQIIYDDPFRYPEYRDMSINYDYLQIHSSGEFYDPFWNDYYFHNGMQEENFSIPGWMQSAGHAIGKVGGSFVEGVSGKQTEGQKGIFQSMAGAAGGMLGGVLGTSEQGSIAGAAATLVGTGIGTLVGGPAGAAMGRQVGSTIGHIFGAGEKKYDEQKAQQQAQAQPAGPSQPLTPAGGQLGAAPTTREFSPASFDLQHDASPTTKPGETPSAKPGQTPAAKPGEKKEEEKKAPPTLQEQLPSLVGSIAGETRMKGCWKRAYYRGFGSQPSVCGDNQSKSGLWCYQNCQEGYKGYNKTCYKDCPAASPGDGWLGTCKRPANYKYGPGTTQPCTGCKKVGLKYYQDCKPGYYQSGSYCKAKCPEGTKDAGFQGCKKLTYTRVSQKATCKDDEQSQFPFCYKTCESNTFGLGPVCWGNCPADKTQCMGVLCLDAGEKCSDNFSTMYGKIQNIIGDLSKNQKGQGIIDIGRLLGDNAPLCPNW